MEKTLPTNDIQRLRDAGLLSGEETALFVGDLVVAENVATKVRRVINISGLLLESNKRVLKG